jgi:large subunit ribosomal protein L13
MRYKTYTPSADTLERKWYVVDAAGMTLGRLASRVAHILRGKHKPVFTTHLDTGDFVIVLNSDKLSITAERLDTKLYRRHSQYPGGFRETTQREMMVKHSDRVIEMAVRGMLPHNKLGRQMIKKLKVYKNNVHPHSAQKPEALDVMTVNVTTWRPQQAPKKVESEGKVYEVGTYVPGKRTPDAKPKGWKAAAEQVKNQPAVRQPVSAKAAGKGDDLQRIEGIGPKVKGALHDAGIITFAQLAEMTGEQLTEIVKVERKVNIVGDANTWPKQAKFIVAGDEAGLKQYQDYLVGGREPSND